MSGETGRPERFLGREGSCGFWAPEGGAERVWSHAADWRWEARRADWAAQQGCGRRRIATLRLVLLPVLTQPPGEGTEARGLGAFTREQSMQPDAGRCGSARPVAGSGAALSSASVQRAVGLWTGTRPPWPGGSKALSPPGPASRPQAHPCAPLDYLLVDWSGLTS